MIDARGFLSPALFASAALRGGRSASAWRQFAAHAAWRIGELRRAGTWIDFVANARPRLCQGPLFGKALEATLAGLSHAAENPKPLRRARRRHRGPAEIPVAHRRAVKGPRSAPSSLTTSGACLEFARQADRRLLDASAARGPEYRLPHAQHEATAGTASGGGVRVPDHPARGTSGTVGLAILEPASHARLDLAYRIADRVSRRIHRFDSTCSNSDPDPAVLLDQWSSMLEGPAADPDPAVLLDQWSSMLEGLAADPDLLHDLTAVPSGTATAKPSPSAALLPASAPGAHEADMTVRAIGKPAFSPPGVGTTQWAAEFSPAEDVAADELTFGAPFRSTLVAALMGAATEPKTERLASGITTPPRPGYDLDSISLAMKRVLDEEARRHGISV
jgi:hypothetical protein